MTNASVDVSFRHVTKRYGELTAVSDLSLNIPRGSFFALLGPSGCGKTTTLRMIAGFETPSEGDVFIRSDNVTAIPPYKRSFGMVFQNYALFPHMNVAQNVAFGLKMRKVPRAESEQRVLEALATVQLGHLAERFPKQLSGGQQQRVALARAIVIKPAVLLLDEPLGALDKQLREEMQVELRQLQQGLGITTVFVTHDQEEALTMADQVAVMRGGMIEQIDSPGEIYERPKTEFVASFLGASNFLTGHVKSTTKGKGAVDISGVIFQIAAEDLPQSGPVKLAVRPEKVRIEPLRGKTIGSNALQAVIRQVVYKGAITHVLMEHAGQPLASLLQNDASRDWTPEPGMEVSCSWSDSSIVPLQAG